jgi:hypothetical protein
MAGKRLALGVLVVALTAAVSGGLSSSSGQSSQVEVGAVYGGPRDGDQAWLRLGSSRRLIAAIELPWTISRQRCSNRKGYFNYMYAGSEYGQPIFVGAKGAFSKTVTDAFREKGSRISETQLVTGTVTDERVSGTIRGKVKIVQPNGAVVRCTFGPHRWILFN